MKCKLGLALCLVLSTACLVLRTAARGDEYRLEELTDAPPEEVAKAVADELAPAGVKVIKGEKRTVCEIWLCAEWTVQEDFKPSAAVLYPFQTGQLIGVLRFPRKGADFREQPIDKGVYTLRYAQQPVDGNHVGTSPTRDFLVLVQAEQDADAKPIAVKTLFKLSAAAAGSSHPAMLCLQRPASAAEKRPALLHYEAHDWWLLQAEGSAQAGGEAKPLPLDLVVVGHAAE